eukprot:IDg513t1
MQRSSVMQIASRLQCKLYNTEKASHEAAALCMARYIICSLVTFLEQSYGHVAAIYWDTPETSRPSVVRIKS